MFHYLRTVKVLSLRLFIITLAIILFACGKDNTSSHNASTNENSSTTIPSVSKAEVFPGGNGSVSYRPFPSFVLPAANLPIALKPNFYAGKALANQPWIKAPTITDARDGLGPIYNARTCLACHIKGGRGAMPNDSKTPLFAAFVRISLPGEDTINGAVPEPVYGLQIQGQSVALFHQLRHSKHVFSSASTEVPPEAYVYIDWLQTSISYPDGEQVTLRQPQLRFEQFGYGALHSDTLTSLRSAPAIHGVGLLERIPQQAIDKLVDPDDSNGDGISGRVNQVWDVETQQTVPGRFGWKANRANIRIVTAAAFNGDIGISNPLFPAQPCSQQQSRCLQTPTGNNEAGFELPEYLLQLVVNFTRNLAVPKRRSAKTTAVKKQISHGRNLFYQIGCAACHTPNYITAANDDVNHHLSGQSIWPYSDLLLHDMGSALADGRPDYQASGSEWRTPPLWGIGLSKQVNGNHFLLHDGRAQTVEEAILWHGGEAITAQKRFVNLEKTQRDALLTFVKSL